MFDIIQRPMTEKLQMICKILLYKIMQDYGELQQNLIFIWKYIWSQTKHIRNKHYLECFNI
jgi:hypothetical protein